MFFVADVHLTPERPWTTDLFLYFLARVAGQAQALYILGDLFEAWVGDDDLDDPFHARLTTRLRRLSDVGVAMYFMAGNRDFLAGDTLAQATGWTPLPDPCRIDLYGVTTLLSHGDAYCTDDHAYQAFRRQVRDPSWQAAFRARPLAERRAMAQAMREQSEAAKAGKRPAIMDVHAAAIHEALSSAGATRMIHGHTHRPARHTLSVDGVECERWVLTDWYAEGGYLACDAGGCRAETLSASSPT